MPLQVTVTVPDHALVAAEAVAAALMVHVLGMHLESFVQLCFFHYLFHTVWERVLVPFCQLLYDRAL